MLIVLINTSKSLEHSIIQLTLITLKYVHSFFLFLSFFLQFTFASDANLMLLVI